MLGNQIPAADPEIVALASAIVDVVTAAKQPGSNALKDAEAALPDLIAAANGIQNIGADIKKPANQAFIVYALAFAFEPQPAAAPAP